MVKDQETGQAFAGFKDLTITCTTSGRGFMVLGDHEGTIHMVDRSFQVQAFDAFNVAVSHLVQLKQNSVLVSIGVRQTSRV